MSMDKRLRLNFLGFKVTLVAMSDTHYITTKVQIIDNYPSKLSAVNNLVLSTR
ncbi:hypothetical protein PGB90_009648 [Kerria lacca]